MRIFFLLVLFITVLLGCAFPILSDNYFIPKYNSKFSLNNADKNGNKSLLDTNAVYYSEKYDIENNGDTIIYMSFDRFFSNGRFYTSRSYSRSKNDISDTISLKEYDIIKIWEDKYAYGNGQKCYYNFQKDGTIRMEVFINGSLGYNFIYARIKEDRMEGYYIQRRSWLNKDVEVLDKDTTKILWVAYKKKVPLTNFNVDW